MKKGGKHKLAGNHYSGSHKPSKGGGKEIQKISKSGKGGGKGKKKCN